MQIPQNLPYSHRNASSEIGFYTERHELAAKESKIQHPRPFAGSVPTAVLDHPCDTGGVRVCPGPSSSSAFRGVFATIFCFTLAMRAFLVSTLPGKRERENLALFAPGPTRNPRARIWGLFRGFGKCGGHLQPIQQESRRPRRRGPNGRRLG